MLGHDRLGGFYFKNIIEVSVLRQQVDLMPI